MAETTDPKARPLTLAEQVAALKREKDHANAKARSARENMCRMRDHCIYVRGSRHECRDHVKRLEKQVATTAEQHDSKAEQLDKVKSVARGALREAKRLQDTETATADAIEAMKEFLSKNAEVTGDSFFSTGRELDRMRALIDKITKASQEASTKAKGTKRRVGYMNGGMFVVFGDIRGRETRCDEGGHGGKPAKRARTPQREETLFNPDGP